MKPGYTSSTKATQSYRLAADVLAGLAAHGQVGSTYLRPNIAPDKNQGTLNVATIPIVIVETLNMANSRDAAIAESESGRQRVASMSSTLILSLRNTSTCCPHPVVRLVPVSGCSFHS